MQEFIDSLQTTMGQALPGLVGALVILAVGWVIAIALKLAVSKAFKLLKVNDLLKNKVDVATGSGQIVYYIVMLLVLLGVFNALNLNIVSVPISNLVNTFFDFLPKLLAGSVLSLVVWVFARIARDICSGGLAATGIDAKIGSTGQPISLTIGHVVYGLVFLLFLPAVLGVFGIEGLIKPAEGMIDQIFGFFPNVLAAALIGFVGWFIAKIVRDLITNLLTAVGVDKAGERLGLQGGFTLSKLVGLVAYIFVLLPAIVSALKALEMESVSAPASEMLASILYALPNIIAAVIILAITYMVAKLVAGLIVKALEGIGFDSIPEKLGFKTSPGKSPSEHAAGMAVFFMMLFATVESANRLEFNQVSELVSFFIQFGGQVLLGTTIIAIGLWLANIVHSSMVKAKSGAGWMASLVRVVILGLVFSIGLRSMGVANDIINMAFGLTLGAAAIAVALSFGIGGREAAGRLMNSWVSKLID